MTVLVTPGPRGRGAHLVEDSSGNARGLRRRVPRPGGDALHRLRPAGRPQ